MPRLPHITSIYHIAALACALAPSLVLAETLVPMASIWSYDTGTDLGTAWQDTSFVEIGWGSGPGILGFGETYISTPVPSGPSNDRHPTAYFRTTFDFAGPLAQIQTMTLRVNYDDSFVAYLNGDEITRRNITGVVDYSQFADGNHESGGYEPIDVSAYTGLVIEGTNLLAVEVHQVGSTSSDLAMDAELNYSSQSSQIARGPYLQIGTETSMVVRWRTTTPTNSRVQWGTDPDALSFSKDQGASTTEHEIQLSGLSSGTRYYYSVGSTEEVFGRGAEYTFTTHPESGTVQSVRIWTLGDSGTANTNARNVRDGYKQYAGGVVTDVWLMLGDNAYNSGTDGQYQGAVFDMYPDFLRSYPLWPTRGNHDDLHTGANNDYYDIFTLPELGQAGGLPSNDEAYYSFDYANIHFVCLDSDGTDRSPTAAMLTWLKNDLNANDQDWIIAFWHHPPYTKGSHDSDNAGDSSGRMRDMRQNALPILEAAGADLVLNGHSHSYERSLLLDEHYGLSSTLSDSMKIDAGDGSLNGDGAYMKAGGGAPHAGAVYITAGSSGQISGGPLNHPVMIVSLNQLGSVAIDVNDNQLDGRFIGTSGQVSDEFTIIKETPTATPAATSTRAALSLGAPNPFVHRSRIAYSLPQAGPVRISVYDVRGRLVRQLVDGVQQAGTHEVVWYGRDVTGDRVSVGMYFAVLEFSGESRTRKLLLQR